MRVWGDCVCLRITARTKELHERLQKRCGWAARRSLSERYAGGTRGRKRGTPRYAMRYSMSQKGHPMVLRALEGTQGSSYPTAQRPARRWSAGASASALVCASARVASVSVFAPALASRSLRRRTRSDGPSTPPLEPVRQELLCSVLRPRCAVPYDPKDAQRRTQAHTHEHAHPRTPSRVPRDVQQCTIGWLQRLSMRKPIVRTETERIAETDRAQSARSTRARATRALR